MPFLSEISDEEKKKIIFRYFIRAEPINQIHNDYRGRITQNSFSRIISLLLNKPEYKKYCMELLMGVEEYKNFTRTERSLGQKNISYWQNEEEMLFQHATYKSLSHEESLIYNKSCLESFQKQ